MDGWYDLYDLDSNNMPIADDSGNYTRVVSTTYNIFPTVTGELVGGRLFDRQKQLLSPDIANQYEIAVTLPHAPDMQITPHPVKENSHYVVRYDGAWPYINAFDGLSNPEPWQLGGFEISGIMNLQLKSKVDSSFAGEIIPVCIPKTAEPGNQWTNLILGQTIPFNKWPIDFVYDESVVVATGLENGFSPALQVNATGDALNQSFIARFGNNLNTTWTGENTDVLFVETFPYITYFSIVDRFPWIMELIDKAEIVARNGGIVYVIGEAWPFAQILVARAGGALNFYGANGIRHLSPNRTMLHLNGELAKATGLDRALAVFMPDITAPVIDPNTTGGAGMRSLATGEIVAETGGILDPDAGVRLFPMVVEFNLGKGKVVYSSFTAAGNLGSTASPEAKKVMRELIAAPLKYANEQRLNREILRDINEQNPDNDPPLAEGGLRLAGHDSKEMHTTISQDFEVDCPFPGDMTFVLQVTDQTLGLDAPSLETLHTLDVSLFTPDGDLFGHQRINGTRVSFIVSADTSPTPEDYIGIWTMKVNEAKGFTPHQVLSAVCVEGLYQFDNGDPGYDPFAHMAYFNLIEGTEGADYLTGASNPESADVFIGAGGDDTYIGGTTENLYTWELGGGNKTIVNSGTGSEPSGVLFIGEGPDLMNLNMEQTGNNLVITLKDEDAQILGSIAVQGWFSSPSMKLAAISFAGRLEMTAEEIESWIAIGGWYNPTEPGEPTAVTGVNLSPSSADLAVGGTVQLTAAVLPPNATSKDVTWSSSDENIATVSGGTVTAVAIGTATITVTTEDGGYTAESIIAVKMPPVSVSSIALTSAALSLEEDGYETLGVVFTPSNATNKNVSWSTSNASVATVVNGTVTALNEGTAAITATTEDGNLTAACVVTVTKKGGSSNPKQQQYETKYPGKNVIIATDGGSQVDGTDGEDVIVSGSGDDWLEGGEGSDIYVYELKSGEDVISNVSNGENDTDELHFGPGITSADLTFSRESDDLLIAITDEEGEDAGNITVEDWYLAEKNKLSKIVLDDGTELTTEEIEALAEGNGGEEAFVAVTGVSLAPSSADIAPGGTLQLTPIILPANATSQDVTWSTTNVNRHDGGRKLYGGMRNNG
jgi:uncharacterized protein YjdB